jgi:hypothetical protein
MVSHEAIMHEQEVYHKLVRLKIFKQFRLWKTFYVWQKSIKISKFANRVSYYAWHSFGCSYARNQP